MRRGGCTRERESSVLAKQRRSVGNRNSVLCVSPLGNGGCSSQLFRVWLTNINALEAFWWFSTYYITKIKNTFQSYFSYWKVILFSCWVFKQSKYSENLKDFINHSSQYTNEANTILSYCQNNLKMWRIWAKQIQYILHYRIGVFCPYHTPTEPKIYFTKTKWKFLFTF